MYNLGSKALLPFMWSKFCVTLAMGSITFLENDILGSSLFKHRKQAYWRKFSLKMINF